MLRSVPFLDVLRRILHAFIGVQCHVAYVPHLSQLLPLRFQ